MKLLQRWKQTSIHNQGLVLTSVLVAIGTLFYAVAAIFQVCIMNKSARDSSAQVERLVGATNAAIKSVVEANSISLKKTLDQNERVLAAALAQAGESLNRSTAQSKAALDGSIKASRNDQRAWLAIADLRIPKEPSAGEKVVVAYSVANSGKTPAICTTAKNLISFDIVEPPSPAWDTVQSTSESIVFPNTTSRDIPTELEAPKITKGVVDTYTSRRSKLYLRTRIDYNDVFGNSHWSEACSVRSFGDSVWLSCSIGGSVDTEGSSQDKKQCK